MNLTLIGIAILCYAGVSTIMSIGMAKPHHTEAQIIYHVFSLILSLVAYGVGYICFLIF